MVVLLPLAAATMVVLVAAIMVSDSALGVPGFTIPRAEDTKLVTMKGNLFGPFVAIVHAGDTVTWSNQDASPHSVVCYPSDGATFEVGVAPGESGAVTFAEPGVYRYYSRQDARFDAEVGAVEANADSPAFPAPMRGVVVVLGRGDSLPLSASTTVDIAMDRAMFEPWAVAVKAGSTVTWVNHDGAMHVVTTPAPELVSAPMPTLCLPGRGGRASHTFTRPGAYYYDCSGNAGWNADRGTPVPLESFTRYPYLMDGLVIVTP